MVEVRQQGSGLAEIAVFITLVDVEGEGELTGVRYLATGAVSQHFSLRSKPESLNF
jgi:hypothetical protein